jgi:hypothetical protein
MPETRQTFTGKCAGFVLLLTAIVAPSLAQQKSAPAEEAMVPAQLSISFERQTIRENDKVPVRIVIVNPSAANLRTVTLRWNLPSDLLTLYAQSCGNPLAPGQRTDAKRNPSSFTWDTVPSNKDANSIQTKDFCLVSSDASEDSFNLGFELQYSWINTDGHTQYATLVVEKPIKSAFLGTDTLAGIPLGLAGLIVPGLLFWMLLDWWQTPWRVQGNFLSDKMVYCALVSMLLIAALKPARLPFLDITSGLSIAKLVRLAMIGATAGLLLGGGDYWIRECKARRTLHPEDDELLVFEKLLRLNKRKPTPSTVVRSKDGTQYRGSVGAQAGAFVFLSGWYKIQSDPKRPAIAEHLKSRIADLLKRAEYLAALRKARANKLVIVPHDFIYSRAPGAAEVQSPARTRLTMPLDQVSGPPEPGEEDKARAPLVLA